MLPSHIGLVPGQTDDEEHLILATHLTIFAVSSLLTAAKLASEFSGAFGDCSVVAALTGNNMRLVSYDGDGLPRVASGKADGTVLSPHTVTLDSLLEVSSDLLIAARLVCSDLVQAFGQPELESISPDGGLRIRAFPRGYHPQLQRGLRDMGSASPLTTPPNGPRCGVLRSRALDGESEIGIRQRS